MFAQELNIAEINLESLIKWVNDKPENCYQEIGELEATATRKRTAKHLNGNNRKKFRRMAGIETEAVPSVVVSAVPIKEHKPVIDKTEFLELLDAPIDACAAGIPKLFSIMYSARIRALEKKIKALSVESSVVTEQSRKLTEKELKWSRKQIKSLEQSLTEFGTSVDRDALFDITCEPFFKITYTKTGKPTERSRKLIEKRVDIANGLLELLYFTFIKAEDIESQMMNLPGPVSAKVGVYQKRLFFYRAQLC